MRISYQKEVSPMNIIWNTVIKITKLNLHFLRIL